MGLESPFASLAKWPASHRAALVVIVQVDGPALENSATPNPNGLDYTASGLQRLLTAFADLDIPVTTAWTQRALATFPQLARRAFEAGHEIAISQVADGNESLETPAAHIAGDAVVGCVTSLPLSDGASGTSKGVPATTSLRWLVTGIGGDVPLPGKAGGEAPITVIPVSPYWIDLTWLSPERPMPPSSFLETWSLGLAAVRAEGGLMTVVLHPHVSGRPGIAGQIVRFLDEVIDSGDTWVATAAQVADWWMREANDD